jgi:hypothetical protein
MITGVLEKPEVGVDSASKRNEYQKMFVGSRVQLVHEADNLTAICEPIV